MTHALRLAREAFARGAWTQALEGFASAADLARGDLEQAAVAAYLTGDDERSERHWEAAHERALADGDVAEAGRIGFWLALSLLLRGQPARASGWLGRTQAIVAESGVECAASGYLLIPALLAAIESGDHDLARDLAVRAGDFGRRFDDADLRALALLGLGQALLASGDPREGTARFDEVMVAVVAGEVGPIASGIVYCAVILECMALLDLQRAGEWTDALSAWCDAQPDLVPYRGQCLVHRSQLQMAFGRWTDAIASADAACRRLVDPPHPALGLAYYQQGELHRLLGELDEADRAYRDASRHGYDPVPGLALLELARGDAQTAATTIRRALHEHRDAAFLAAAVDILRTVGDISGARAAADDVTAFATTAPSRVLGALAAYCRGSVLVAEGEQVAALGELRTAAREWHSLQMPYEAARTGVLLGLACAALGDGASAAIEFDNARATFAALGARPDLDRLDHLTGQRPGPSDRSGLSSRELEVLVQLAAGKTNREVAVVLNISQHTVGRHVENIYSKLGVTSRAAATARAYALGLIAR